MSAATEKAAAGRAAAEKAPAEKAKATVSPSVQPTAQDATANKAAAQDRAQASPAPAKRGRPRKDATQSAAQAKAQDATAKRAAQAKAQDATQSAAPATAQDATAKRAAAPTAAQAASAQASPAPAKRGRPRKEAAQPATQAATAKKAAQTKAATQEAAPKAARGRAAKKKILFAVSEVAPFVATGGMGQVVSILPSHLMRVAQNLDVRVIAPYYRQIRQQFGACMAYLGSVTVQLAWRSAYCGVYRAEKDGVVYYFLDNEQYFDRENCYGYFDDGERFAFFSKAVLVALEIMDFVPHMIHAHDWQTALIPVYLKTSFAAQYPKIRSVYTIHNIEYQGRFPLSIISDVFDLHPQALEYVEYQGSVNLVKGAIECCDWFTTVSPSYAEEIKVDGAFGIEPIIRGNEGKLSGIVNGIDTALYDPATDRSLAQTYDVESVGKKAVNKRDLQTLFGLPPDPRTPVLCIVSRLVHHKGMDLIMPIIEELLSGNVQLLILGTGDHQYELFFTELALRHPDKVGVNIAYNPEIGSKIYGGADIMLMPSLAEPCGLSQMIACRYGTVPVARATGGLKDTVRDCRLGDGNGFLFVNYDADELLDTARQALHMYNLAPDDWRNLMCEAMRSDFNWDKSAKAYADIYASLR